jgi:hypothetical protein
MRPYAGVDYNFTLCHMYHKHPYARIDFNSLPESTVSPSNGLGFGRPLLEHRVPYPTFLFE